MAAISTASPALVSMRAAARAAAVLDPGDERFGHAADPDRVEVGIEHERRAVAAGDPADDVGPAGSGRSPAARLSTPRAASQACT